MTYDNSAVSSPGSVVDIQIMIGGSLSHAEIERNGNGFTTVHLIQLVAHLIVLCADDDVDSHQGVEFGEINALFLQFTIHLVAVDPKLISISILPKFGYIHIAKVIIKMDLIETEWVFKVQRTSFDLERKLYEQFGNILFSELVNPVFKVSA